MIVCNECGERFWDGDGGRCPECGSPDVVLESESFDEDEDDLDEEDDD
jgi:rRNA maturation endonuclease Nob1